MIMTSYSKKHQQIMKYSELEGLINRDANARAAFLADPVGYLRSQGLSISEDEGERVRMEIQRTVAPRAPVLGSNAGIAVAQ
jgi:hypothetical protein